MNKNSIEIHKDIWKLLNNCKRKFMGLWKVAKECKRKRNSFKENKKSFQ